MPTVTIHDRELECETDAVLRNVLLRADESPHNGRADTLNCRGLGSCGTCAVAVSGEVGAPGSRERLRLSIPPHDTASGLRLACQLRVEDDLVVEKYPGYWGQHTDRTEEKADPEEP
ncbi:2Fe-2S iron-sulfur cluster-binding protein [Natronobacterium gregoryi]|uniref:(2Fe-2S)-binding protein n=2 Tax=Natronobacterium gregoryi TaxID=44930 RepID=L0AJ03_NATGS|nr:2Fe-2S iron-sulfur cluster-binding protein [Natronobacterium gregoryi]AFZ73883.1 ferredoxin [Natronobacterium gregoryi SP2]ELY64839.1 ferredoxin [Natronobacterium gregoryi SP2]PLK19159.1 (2Fe-2S)-binding protein [Natronobacterium gregoryi SP2]SFJ59411.1 2Fe-2S iron-sulfur cluster binding domain-containing protein [Natronobacterium gregoryi]